MHDPTLLPNLESKLVLIESLRPRPDNPRIHTKKQIQQVAESIKTFGFVVPILIDQNGGIIAGHARHMAARLLGLRDVPTICASHLGDAQIRALVIADNKLTENADWDHLKLGETLQFLSSLELDFELTTLGFETAEIDILIDEHLKTPGSRAEEKDAKTADELLASAATLPTVSKKGDGWRLGRHFLWCDDARDHDAFKRLLQARKAQMVFIDAPYNLKIEGNVSGLGKIKHRNFLMAAGEMTEAEYIAFLIAVLQNLVAFCIDGCIMFVCIDWRHIYEAITAARSVGLEFKQLIVWSKTNAGMGTFYRSKHELLLVLKVGTAPHINTFGLGEKGRYRSNVWTYPGANTMQVGRLEELALHSTVKPLALVSDAIKDCSRRGGVILDCFVGSGTSLIAAEVTGRRAYTMELDPTYVDTAIRRYQAYTGEAAIHIESGQTFSEREAAMGVQAHG